MSKKRGKLSLEEEDYIRQSAATKKVADIALALNRTSEPVIRFIKQENLVSFEMNEDDVTLSALIDKLHGRPYWDEVKEQLTEEELEHFRLNWINIVLQFREDVLFTEELQIRDLLILQILIGRSMKERKEHYEDKSRLDVQLAKEYAKPEDERNVMEISTLEQQLASSKVAIGSYNTEHMKLLSEVKYITKSLKATREERVKKIEDSKSSWVGHLKMLEDEGLRERQGVDLAIHAKAKDVAIDRLGQWHQYEDGVVDQPFLNYLTVKHENEEIAE